MISGYLDYLKRVVDEIIEKDREQRRRDEFRATVHMWDAHREILEELDTITHVDRITIDPLSSSYADGRLLMRCESLDDPRIGAQERDGWATYVYVTEPHTMAECAFDAEGKHK